MNKQAIFDKVALHLLTQGERAYDEVYGGCRYFDENTGNTCAVGCLIPKKDYDPIIEGITVSEVLFYDSGSGRRELEDILHKQGIRNKSFELLSDLQDIHDQIDPADWPVALIDFAKENKLHHGVVDNFVKKHK